MQQCLIRSNFDKRELKFQKILRNKDGSDNNNSLFKISNDIIKLIFPYII